MCASGIVDPVTELDARNDVGVVIDGPEYFVIAALDVRDPEVLGPARVRDLDLQRELALTLRSLLECLPESRQVITRLCNGGLHLRIVRLDIDSFVSVCTPAEQRQQSTEDNTDESSLHALPRGYWYTTTLRFTSPATIASKALLSSSSPTRRVIISSSLYLPSM